MKQEEIGAEQRQETTRGMGGEFDVCLDWLFQNYTLDSNYAQAVWTERVCCLQVYTQRIDVDISRGVWLFIQSSTIVSLRVKLGKFLRRIIWTTEKIKTSRLFWMSAQMVNMSHGNDVVIAQSLFARIQSMFPSLSFIYNMIIIRLPCTLTYFQLILPVVSILFVRVRMPEQS